MPEIKEVIVQREVWILKGARWNDLKDDLSNVAWSPLKRGTAEDALNYFLDILWTLLVKHIPRKQTSCMNSSHSWFNSRCRAAIIHKNNSEGTDFFKLHAIRVRAFCVRNGASTLTN